jgi:hypothetical protein
MQASTRSESASHVGASIVEQGSVLSCVNFPTYILGSWLMGARFISTVIVSRRSLRKCHAGSLLDTENLEAEGCRGVP